MKPWIHKSKSRTQNAEPSSSWTCQNSSQVVLDKALQTHPHIHPPLPHHCYYSHPPSSSSDASAFQLQAQESIYGTFFDTWIRWCIWESEQRRHRRLNGLEREAQWVSSNVCIGALRIGFQPRKLGIRRGKRGGRPSKALSFEGLRRVFSRGSSRNGAGLRCLVLVMRFLWGLYCGGVGRRRWRRWRCWVRCLGIPPWEGENLVNLESWAKSSSFMVWTCTSFYSAHRNAFIHKWQIVYVLTLHYMYIYMLCVF